MLKKVFLTVLSVVSSPRFIQCLLGNARLGTSPGPDSSINNRFPLLQFALSDYLLFFISIFMTLHNVPQFFQKFSLYLRFVPPTSSVVDLPKFLVYFHVYKIYYAQVAKELCNILNNTQ